MHQQCQSPSQLVVLAGAADVGVIEQQLALRRRLRWCPPVEPVLEEMVPWQPPSVGQFRSVSNRLFLGGGLLPRRAASASPVTDNSGSIEFGVGRREG